MMPSPSGSAMVYADKGGSFGTQTPHLAQTERRLTVRKIVATDPPPVHYLKKA